MTAYFCCFAIVYILMLEKCLHVICLEMHKYLHLIFYTVMNTKSTLGCLVTIDGIANKIKRNEETKWLHLECYLHILLH